MPAAWRKPEALAPAAANHVQDITRPLGGLNGQRPPAPDGYRAAMAMPVEEHRIDETMPYVPDYRPRLYASETEALDRFRFAPEQPGTNLYIIDDITRAQRFVGRPALSSRRRAG